MFKFSIDKFLNALKNIYSLCKIMYNSVNNKYFKKDLTSFTL